jgi:hypothetical protein
MRLACDANDCFPKCYLKTSWRGTLEISNPENKMLAHLPIVILASLLPMPVADAMPKLDIARECQFEGGIKPTQERCAADEAQARNELQNEWKQFGPDAIKQCNEESTTDNISSYVELLTCLEMERDVRNPPR